MLSIAVEASDDSKLLQPLSTGLEKVNLTLRWRENLCCLNNLILHCFTAGTETGVSMVQNSTEHPSVKSETNPSALCWVSPTMQLLIHQNTASDLQRLL